MTAILFCGPADAAVCGEIERVLSGCGGVCRCTGDELIVPADCRFLLTGAGRSPRLRTHGGVCVFAEVQGPFARWRVPPGFVAVAHSADRSALRLLEKQGTPAVTCGMSAADTITLSSFQDDGAVVSLQRGMVDLQGERIEPGDYPVRLAAPISNYGLMAALSVLLLAGGDPAEELKDRLL